MVHTSLNVIETGDFHLASIKTAHPERFDALITYTRTWEPANGVLNIPQVRRLLGKYYEWQPDITPEQCATLGLHEAFRETLRGQTIAMYLRK
jgi:hypothetical protein